jgi:hypothetical protein
VIAIFGSFMLDILGRRVQTFTSVSGMIVSLLVIGGMIKRASKLPNAIQVCNEGLTFRQNSVKAQTPRASMEPLPSSFSSKDFMRLPSHQ